MQVHQNEQAFRFFPVAIMLWAITGVLSIAGENSRPAGVDNAAPAATQSSPSTAVTNLPIMEVAQAVMVTVELDFGKTTPSIQEALTQVERRYLPEDRHGRTFAILDAYGEPTTDGKLHISMHVSSEKPGVGMLVFKKTGEIFWQSRIVPASHPPSSTFAGKKLLIMLDDEAGKSSLLDGSKGVTSVLDATVRDTGVLVRDFWPDGAEREVTFFYSACGCPVKVMARRSGEKTARTKEVPVIFPDDPAIVAAITRLMGW
jgi:hypothetical protein